MRPERIDNDVFYHARPLGAPADAPLPEAAPHREAAGFFARSAESTTLFALLLFGLGWLGILVQASFFQQVVVGAPLFEEPAKVGAPLLLCALLRLRAPFFRFPLALVSGAGFGILEHYVTYADEGPWTFASRVVFHALTALLSMAAFHALERAPDVRVRWATTAPATLLHYANNFGALALGVLSAVAVSVELVASIWTWGVTGAVVAATIAILARPGDFRALVESAGRRVLHTMRAMG